LEIEFLRVKNSTQSTSFRKKMRATDLSSFRRIYDPLIADLQENGLRLNNYKPEYKKNRTLVLTAVKNNGMALKYAHESMKSNKDIAENAIIQNIESAQFFSDSLKNDVAWPHDFHYKKIFS
jgi:hypothetical protein